MTLVFFLIYSRRIVSRSMIRMMVLDLIYVPFLPNKLCLGNDYSEQEDRFMVKSMMVVMEDQDDAVGADMRSISHIIVFLFSRPLK